MISTKLLLDGNVVREEVYETHKQYEFAELIANKLGLNLQKVE